MSSLKEKIEIVEKEEELKLARLWFGIRQVIEQFSPLRRKIIAACFLALIPTYLIVRFSAKQVIIWQQEKNSLRAHASYSDAKPIKSGEVTVLPVAPARWAAYTQVSNDNLDLAASRISYRFIFTDRVGDTVSTSTGKFYLLPNEKKYLVAPRIDNPSITSGRVEFTDVQWQKRIQIPKINLRPDVPTVFDEAEPRGLAAQGLVFNDSPYPLGMVHLTILLYDRTGRIIGVNARDEFTLRPAERRAYKVTWPNLTSSQVARAVVQAETDTLDANNLRPVNE